MESITTRPLSERKISNTALFFVLEPLLAGWDAENASLLQTARVQIQLQAADASRSRLLTRAAGTDIVVTPMSRGGSVNDLSQCNSEPDLNLLCPEID